MRYDDFALGVECALPARLLMRRRSRVRWLLKRLALALRRWG
jgi:hypothetical protein